MKRAREEAERREREEEERKKREEREEERRLQGLEVGAETTVGDCQVEQVSADDSLVCCGGHYRLPLIHTLTRTCVHMIMSTPSQTHTHPHTCTHSLSLSLSLSHSFSKE